METLPPEIDATPSFSMPPMELLVDEDIKLIHHVASMRLVSQANYDIIYRGERAGIVQLAYDHDQDETELAYSLEPNFRNKHLGIATRAAKHLCDFSFMVWGIQNIILNIPAANENSQKVAQRLGATMDLTRSRNDWTLWTITRDEP